MKNILLLAFSCSLFDLTAQKATDTLKFHLPLWVSNATLEVQTHSYDEINNLLQANNFPSLDNASLRFVYSGRMQRKNSGLISGIGFEWMKYSYAAANSAGNRTSLSDIGLNLMVGYNLLHKKTNMMFFPHYRISLVYRDMVLTNNKNYSSATFNNFLNGNITNTSLSNIAFNLDLGLTYEINFFKTKREQALIGVSAGYRLSPIQGFGENEVFKITDKSGNYTTANLGGFYAGLSFSSYRLKRTTSERRVWDLN